MYGDVSNAEPGHVGPDRIGQELSAGGLVLGNLGSGLWV